MTRKIAETIVLQIRVLIRLIILQGLDKETNFEEQIENSSKRLAALLSGEIE